MTSPGALPTAVVGDQTPKAPPGSPNRRIRKHGAATWDVEFYEDEQGLRHREGGPAEVIDREDGVRTERWFHHGALLRTDGPAEVEYRDGLLNREHYRTRDVTSQGWHREDGPAAIEYLSDGVSVFVERWYVEGMTHRDHGPATTYFYGLGAVEEQVWYVDGLISRIDGPARIKYDVDGVTPTIETHYYRDKRYASLDFIGKELVDGSLGERRRAVACSSFGDLLVDGVTSLEIATALAAGVVTVEGMRAVLDGSPVEWVRAFETGRS